MKEKLLDIHVLKTILKNKVSERVYGKLTTDVFTRQNYDLKDILKFFIKTYASLRELEENLMKFHQKTGTSSRNPPSMLKRNARNPISRR